MVTLIADHYNIWGNLFLNTSFTGKLTFNIWLVLGIGTAFITGSISFVDYYVKHEISTPMVGLILFSVGFFDIFHLLVANHVINIGLDPLTGLYVTWFVSRLLHAIFLAGSTWYLVYLNKRFIRGTPQKKRLLVRLSICYAVIVADVILFFFLAGQQLGNLSSPRLYTSFSYEAIPIAVYVIWGLLILPKFQLKYPSVFSRMLVLSIIPAIFAEIAMCFHSYEFDAYFDIAYLMRFLSYLVPLWGIAMNYIETIKKEKDIVYRLDNEIHERLIAQKELEKREALLVNAERIAHLGSWEFNTLANELKWSDEMFSIYGYKTNDITPTMILQEQLVAPKYRNEVRNTFNSAIHNRSSYSLEYQVLRPNGEARFLLGQGTYLKKSNKLVGTVLDITELKEAQNALEIKINELNRSNSELEQFAYVASHDLQEPLRKIKAFGDRLNNKYSNLLPEEGVDYIGRMTNASQRMQTLIDDLLTFSRMSRQEENSQLVDLSEVLNGVLNDLEVGIEKKNAQVVVKVTHKLKAVPGQMRQLFQNLISNALKFSKEAVAPEISITSAFIEGNKISNIPGIFSNKDYCRIVVQDNGIGFDKEYANTIFVLFQRLHTRNEYEGTGIGLAVCKKIIDNHQGIILAESEKDKGTAFTMYLPVES